MGEDNSQDLKESSKALEKLREANDFAIEKLVDYELKFKSGFQKLDDILEELIRRKNEKQNSNGCFLLPKTPAAPKRRGRRPKGEAEDSVLNASTNSSRSTRSSRAASRAASSKITANVDEISNLNKKKRRPTSSTSVQTSTKPSISFEEKAASSDDMSGVEPIAHSIEEPNYAEIVVVSSSEDESIPVVSEDHGPMEQEVDADVPDEPEVDADVPEESEVDDDVPEESEVVVAVVPPVDANTDVDMADAEDTDSGKVSEGKRKSNRKTRSIRRSKLIDSSEEESLPSKKPRLSQDQAENRPVPAPRNVKKSEQMNSTFTREDEVSEVSEINDKEQIVEDTDSDRAISTSVVTDEKQSRRLTRTNQRNEQSEKVENNRSRSTRTKQLNRDESESSDVERPPSRSTRTKQRNLDKSESSEAELSTQRSTRTKQKNLNKSESSDVERPSSRSTRTKQRKLDKSEPSDVEDASDKSASVNQPILDQSESSEAEARGPRSTRTKQRNLDKSESSNAERPASRSTRTKQRNQDQSGISEMEDSKCSEPEVPAPRSTRTRQRNVNSSTSSASDKLAANESVQEKTSSSSTSDMDDILKAPETGKEVEDTNEKEVTRVSRSTRTKQKQVAEEKEEFPKRSTRTKQRVQEIESSASEKEEAPARRTTRTKQRLIASGSESSDKEGLTRSAASPRVRELAIRALSPANQKRGSPRTVGYTGSPIRDRVQIFENAMRDSAGLKTKSQAAVDQADTGSGAAESTRRSIREKENRDSLRRSITGRISKGTRRSSSAAQSLLKASAARRISVTEVLKEQEINIKEKTPTQKSKAVIRTGSEIEKNKTKTRVFNEKVVRPKPKVIGSGGRGVSPAVGSGKSGMNSGSASLYKIKSRVDLSNAEKSKTGPTNLIRIPGVTSFLPGKPKQPTIEEIQEKKEEEMKKKQEKEEEAIKRREDMLKKKAEEQREKREERIRRVQEARMQQENQKEKNLKKTQAKETEEKLAALRLREEKMKEAEKKKKEAEQKMRLAEERRKKEEEERHARAEKLEEETRRREEEEKLRRREEEEEKKRRLREEEEKKRLKKMEEKRKLDEKKKAESLRIVREKEELRMIKEREAENQKAVDLNSTYNKPSKPALNTTHNLNTTQTLNSTQTVSSYDMTPARIDLPPEPPKTEDDYGIDDLTSGDETDDDEKPRKIVPKWAVGNELRTALLKQYWIPPSLEMIFFLDYDMPDLSSIFKHQRKRFFKRTSSAQWTPPGQKSLARF